MTAPPHVTREPPADVRRKLRREAGFVCAHPDCFEPYLEYHHFEPPWHVEPHHRPEGMIALCPGHHRRAASWLASDFHSWKYRGPKSSVVRHKVEWTRSKTAFVVGGNVVIGCQVVLAAEGVPVIWVIDDAYGRSMFNFSVCDLQGRPVFEIRDND